MRNHSGLCTYCQVELHLQPPSALPEGNVMACPACGGGVRHDPLKLPPGIDPALNFLDSFLRFALDALLTSHHEGEKSDGMCFLLTMPRIVAEEELERKSAAPFFFAKTLTGRHTGALWAVVGQKSVRFDSRCWRTSWGSGRYGCQ
jgi:hypothetical protein